MHSVGLDVGGTKVLGVLVDTDAPDVVLREERVPTPDGGDGLLETLVALAASLSTDPVPVGVGVPGLVDRDGVLHVGAHLRHVRNVPLAAELHGRLRTVAVVDNDANCHALAEQAVGAAAGAEEVLVITLGTGIGAGIVTGGALLRGVTGFAGEPGHMIVDPNGPPCPCGRRGCWERFASGTGLGRLARDAAHGGRLDAAVALAGGDPEAVRGEHVTASARAGDAEAMAVIGDLAHWTALGLANLVNVLDPEVIVIGGGLVEAADLLLPEVRERMRRLVLSGRDRPEVRIVPAALGERAGAIGAALLTADR